MRLTLLTAAVLLLTGVTMATLVTGETALVARDSAVEKAGLMPLAQARNSDLEKAKQGLDAVQKFVDIFAAGIFMGTPVGVVAQLLSKVLSFVVAFMGLFGGKTESAEMQFMRKQFAETHAKLDGVSLQLGDVKELIKWSSTRVMYSRLEQHIRASGKLFDLYMKASNSDRENRKYHFTQEFKKEENAALKLYQGIMDNANVISENLADAAVAFTQNHKRKVMSFLLSLTRLILRGSQMQIAYVRMVRSENAARLLESDWKGNMGKLAKRMDAIHTKILNGWNAQMKSDVSRFVLEQRGLSNRDFSGAIYRFLADKFDWRNWLSVIYKDVSGFDNHAYAICDGNALLRTHGSRNVIVASASKSTRFSKSKATGILQKVDGEVRRRYAKDFVDRISNHLGNYCTDAAARIAVCWGCDVWYTGIGSRIAYRKMNAGGKYMNVVLFG